MVKRGLRDKIYIKSKHGQLTIFIIVAIVLVLAVVGYFLLRGTIKVSNIPTNIEPVYTSFLSCLQDDTSSGINVLGFQAGYIQLPNFEPGSMYMPFSSQLDFLGNPIPYWYYVSGNNIQKEQVPTITNMQNQLATYIENKITSCNFDSFYSQGYEISFEKPKATTTITDNNVAVNLNMRLSIKKGQDSFIVDNHQINVKSNIGKLYNAAKKLYQYEQQSLFLENYAVDTLRSYAPVDGVELSCSPLTWNPNDVFDNLENAIEANTQALKIKGGRYTLAKPENKYFIVPIDIGENVFFLNSKNWTKSFEVDPTQGNLLIAQPVGNQAGLGILGFCYVPYHFVYSIKYPVLIQLMDGNELFQFPVAVVVQGNKPRNPLNSSASDFELPQICQYRNTPIQVNSYDTSLNPIEADISFECLASSCDIGKTKISGGLTENFPQCANGYIRAQADGYEDAKYLINTTQPGTANIILNRIYPINVSLRLDGKFYNSMAIISFVSNDLSTTIVYPQQNTIKLAEGQYNVTVNIYRNSSLTIPAQTNQQCVDVPRQGLGGLFGLTDKKCYDIQMPQQIVSNVLIGGGQTQYYVLESQLQQSTNVEIQATSLPTPKTIEDLQNNYILFADKGLDIYFK